MPSSANPLANQIVYQIFPERFAIGAPPGTFHLAMVSTNACGTGAATAPQTVSFP